MKTRLYDDEYETSVVDFINAINRKRYTTYNNIIEMD